ncbi:MAG: PAS domain S-box protein, partial [Candidatus Thorarchaeota archaeon]
MVMSKKTGERKQRPKKSGAKTKKQSLPVIPTWNDEMIEAILNNSHDGIVILGDDYNFEYINERGLAIYGGTASDLVGKDFRLFMKEDMAQMVSEYYDMRRKGENVPSVYPFRIVRKDGIEVAV